MSDTAQSSKSGTVIAAGIGVLVGLALGGGAAGYAWWTGQQSLADAHTRYQELEQTSQQALAEHNKQLEAATRRAVDRTVRIELARALDELDRRNFGSAQDRLQAARKALSEASPPVQEAAKGLDQLDLKVTDETGEQRDALMTLARRIDLAIE